MWLLRPRHTVESVLARLVAGLEDGTIVLSRDDRPVADTPPPAADRPTPDPMPMSPDAAGVHAGS